SAPTGMSPLQAGKPAPHESLVLRDAGIDLVAPRQDAAHHVAHALEARLAQHGTGLGAAHAAAAVDHDVGSGIELADALGKLAERNELRAGDVADPVLVR